MLAGERRRFLGPHPLHDRRRLGELLEPSACGRKREAVAFELLGEPTRAETDDDPPAGDVIERGRHLRVQRGVAETGRRDEQSELGLGGDRADRGERRPRLENRDRGHRHTVEMVVQPERIEAELFELERRRTSLLPAPLDLRQRRAEAYPIVSHESPSLLAPAQNPPRDGHRREELDLGHGELDPRAVRSRVLEEQSAQHDDGRGNGDLALQSGQ